MLKLYRYQHSPLAQIATVVNTLTNTEYRLARGERLAMPDEYDFLYYNTTLDGLRETSRTRIHLRDLSNRELMCLFQDCSIRAKNSMLRQGNTHSMSPTTWKHERNVRRIVAESMREYIKALKDGSRYEMRSAISDLAESLNSYSVCDSFKSSVAERTRELADEHDRDGYHLVHCSCGHVAEDGCTTTMHNGAEWCDSCRDDDAHEIDGEWYSESDLYYWESDGEWHLDEEPEEDDDYCSDDDDIRADINSWGSSTRHLCHDRSFTPTPYGDFTMGIELEVESRAGEKNTAAEDTLMAFNDWRNGYIMLKEDGSLSCNGFEIVTAARSLPDHIKQFGAWEPHSSLRAWNPGTCGLHVHIDSRAFTGLTLGKFLMFINDYKNKALIKAIAGRHPADGGTAESYCAAAGQTILETPAMALKGNHHSRYRMTNLTNVGYDEQKRLGIEVDRNCKGDYSTVELRIFRASLKKERLLAQIEFSNAAVHFCRVASWHELDGAGFKTWLAANAGGFKHLARWFGINVPKPNKTNAPALVREVDETTV